MVSRLWPESTIVCIGGGPSLTREDVEACRDRARVIAINNAYQLAGFADVLYGCDGSWWRRHNGVPSFTGLKFALTPPSSRWAATAPDVAKSIQVLKWTPRAGLSLEPGHLFTGGGPDGTGNGGYQAINLAFQLGARRILLLGYDLQVAPDGKTHWHPPHSSVRSPYAEFRRGFPKLVEPLKKAGVEVINCTRSSALTCFPKLPLAEALRVEVAA